MDKKLFDNFIEYYKNEQENDDRYLKRSVLEERDTYRIIQGLSGKGDPIIINKLGDFARLLISAQNISFSNGRNWYQDFISSEVATRFMQDVVLQSKELAEIVQEYQEPAWPYEHPATPMEQQHELVEKFIDERGREEFRNIGKQIRKIISNNNDISVSTSAKVELELTEYQQQIVAISKMMMRFYGRAPKEDVLINNGSATVGSIDGAVLIKQTEEEIQEKILEQKSKNKQETNIQSPYSQQMWKTHKSEEVDTFKQDSNNQYGWKHHSKQEENIQSPYGQQMWKTHKLEEVDTFKQDSNNQHGWKRHSQQEDKIKKRQAIVAMKWREMTDIQADLSQKSIGELMELSRNIKEMLDEESNNNMELDNGLINILELISESLKEKGSNGGRKKGLTPGISMSQKEHKIAMQRAQNIESYIRELKMKEQLQPKQQQSNKRRKPRGMHR